MSTKRIMLMFAALGLALAVMLVQQVTASQPPSRDAQIYAQSIRALVGQQLRTENTIYIVTHTTAGTSNEVIVFKLEPQPILEPTQREITAILGDLPGDVVWVPDQDTGMAAAQPGDLVIGLGRIQPQEDGSVQVVAGYVCPGWCGQGWNYILEIDGSLWHVTGSTGGWTS